MFTKLQLLMSLSMNQFIQWFVILLVTSSVIIYRVSAHHLSTRLQAKSWSDWQVYTYI